MSTDKAIVYNPLPPLELGAAVDRTGLSTCTSLQAALMRLQKFQAIARCPDLNTAPVLPYQLKRMMPRLAKLPEAVGIQCAHHPQ